MINLRSTALKSGSALAALLSVSLWAGPGLAADDGWRVLAIEEDDYWGFRKQDRHYTHGIRLDAVSPDLQDPTYQAPFSWAPNFPQSGERSRRLEFMVGQNIYTPEDLTVTHPDTRDRPYAGWLYLGFGMMQDTDHRRFDRLVIRLGMVGPAALADRVQISFHTIIDAGKPKGWAHQLHDEATLDLFAERKWRASALLVPAFGLAVDALPQAAIRLGNVYDYVAVGGLVRFGRNLLVDYGPPHIDENLGAVVLDPDIADSKWAWYVFAGLEGRLTARSIFLDGNSFAPGAHVTKNIAVADLEAGLAVLYGPLRLGYTLMHRTREFVGQRGADQIGSINVGFRASF